MDLTIRDLCYFGGYIVSVTVIITAIRARLTRAEEKIDTLDKVVFKERGGLSMVPSEDCEKFREAFKEDVRGLLVQNQCLEQNVIKMMIAMNLEPVLPEKRKTTR